MIQTDSRIGGHSKQYLVNSERALVNVPDEIRKCVAFLTYEEKPGEEVAAATAFFVYSRVNLTGGFTYLVTAAHVIEGLRDVVKAREIFVRLNARDGGVMRVSTEASQWVIHPTDKTVDVAVLPWTWNNDHDGLAYPVVSAATREVMTREGIGLGDEVFLSGLYTRHHGKTRNIPIIRIGNLAAMPEEPVHSARGPLEWYLIEVRSISGLSGSPVFVHADAFQATATGYLPRKPGFYLLGLMHGHWSIKHIAPIMFEIDADYLKQPLNSGIAVVVPIEKILEVINQPSEWDRREEQQKLAMRERWTDEDSATDSPLGE
jgi:hypothetical protein